MEFSSRRAPGGCRLALLGSLVVGLAARADGGDEPAPIRSQSWRIQSFLEDAGLEGRSIFELAFDPQGVLWAAASDGLYRCDGYGWERFTNADSGLPSDHVRSLCIASDGRLWVGTECGAGTFDGRHFELLASETELAGPSVRRIREDPDGTLWFCCDQWPDAWVPGGLSRLRDGEWTSYRTADGLPSDFVLDTFLDSEGRRFVMTLAGLAQFDGEHFRLPLEDAGVAEPGEVVRQMLESLDIGVLAVTQNALFVLDERGWRRSPVDVPGRAGTTFAVTTDGDVLSCLNTEQIRFWQLEGDRVRLVADAFIGQGRDLQTVVPAPDGSIWVAGSDLLARWSRRGGEWEAFDLPPPYMRDSDGGVWFASTTEVARFADDQWTSWRDVGQPLVEDAFGSVWMRAKDGLARWRAGTLTKFDAADLGLRGGGVRDLDVDADGRLWVIGIEAEGRHHIVRFEQERWISLDPHTPGTNERIVSGCADPVGGMWYALERPGSALGRLVHLEESRLREVQLPEATRNTQVVGFLVDRRGGLWVYGHFGLFQIEANRVEAPRSDADQVAASGADRWERVSLPSRSVLRAHERGGELWFVHQGTSGGVGGLSRLGGSTWTHFPAPGRVVSGGSDDNATFWASPDGQSLAMARPRDEISVLSLPQPARVRSAILGREGELWVGVGNRTLRFHSDGAPPETLLRPRLSELKHGDDLVLEVRGVEHFKPTSQTATFSVAHRLDGGEWTPFRMLEGETITVASPAAGSHELQVRVRDEGLDVDPTPAHLSFEVKPIPLQSRRWFLPVTAALFTSIVLLAAFGFRARRKLAISAARLEQAVEVRTAELDHRVKNSLAMVQAISEQTLQSSGSAGEFAESFRGRIASMARAHEALAHRKWTGANLRDILTDTLEPFRGRDGHTIAIRGEDVTLPVRAVLPVSMTLHELGTNAVKYGSLSVPAGRIDIEWELNERELLLRWTESGGPPVSSPGSRGFGTTLIEHGIAYELGGTTRLDFLPSGVTCEIRAELS